MLIVEDSLFHVKHRPKSPGRLPHSNKSLISYTSDTRPAPDHATPIRFLRGCFPKIRHTKNRGRDGMTGSVVPGFPPCLPQAATVLPAAESVCLRPICENCTVFPTELCRHSRLSLVRRQRSF